MNIDIDKIRRKMAELKREREENDLQRGYCRLVQPPIDADLAKNAAAQFYDEAAEFLLSVCELMLESGELLELGADHEIKTKIERWIDLIWVMGRAPDILDKHTLFIPLLHCLLRDKDTNIKAGWTPIKLAGVLTSQLKLMHSRLIGFRQFYYDYSEIIDETKKWKEGI